MKPRTGNAENEEVKNLNKPTVCFPNQRPSGQHFLIDSEQNGFTSPNQRNFNFRFPPNSFVQDGRFWRCNGPVDSISDRGTSALVVAKEGTGANTKPISDTETKVEGMKIDNEFCDLSMDYTT